jgi:hypothetical protein
MTYQIYTNENSVPYTVTVTGAAGSMLQSSGASYNWNTITTADPNLTGKTLQVNGSADITGDANFQGDVKIKGKSIVDSLERIEERLAILRPNEELEEKWENLRGLRKAYMELEAEIKEKEQIWATLKK